MHRGALAWLVVFVPACAYDRDAFYEPREAAALTPYEAALQIWGAGECAACIARECDAEARACEADTDCADEALCLAACGLNDPPCRYWECRDRYPLAEEPTAAVQICARDKCPVECRPGHDWGCVGNYVARRPASREPIRFSLRLASGLGFAPAPAGIRARVCSFGDNECADPRDEAFTDASGLVTVEFPVPVEEVVGDELMPFLGYVELSDPGNEPPRFMTSLIHTMGVGGPAYGLPRSNVQPWLRPVFTPGDIAVFEMVGFPLEPGRGMVQGISGDCRATDHAFGAGLTIEADTADASASYSYALSATATETGPTFLTAGLGVFNLPPGSTALTVFHEAEVVSTMDVVVRADAVTFAWFGPNPAH